MISLKMVFFVAFVVAYIKFATTAGKERKEWGWTAAGMFVGCIVSVVMVG